MVSTQLKNISQNGNLPQVGVKKMFETTSKPKIYQHVNCFAVLPPKNLASSTPEDQECRCKQAKKSSLWWQKRRWWYLKNPTNFQNKHTVHGRNPAPVQDFFHQQEYVTVCPIGSFPQVEVHMKPLNVFGITISN